MKQHIRGAAAFLLGIVMMGTTVSAASDSAYSIYERGMKKMEGVTSMESQMDIVSTVTTGDMSMKITGQATMRQVVISKDQVELEMLMTSKFGAEELQTATYYKDGVLYQNTMGQKTKSKMDLSQALAMYYDMDRNLSQELLKNATVKQVADGTSISFKLDSELLDSAMKDALTAATDSMGMPGMTLKLGDIGYTVVFGSDDMMKSYSMIYDATMSYEGISAKIGYEITSKVVSTNQLSKIDFPADLNSYKDTTSSAAATVPGAAAI